MLIEKLDMFFKFPSFHFPKFPKLSLNRSADFGKASMSTTEFHCVNGTCDGKVTRVFRVKSERRCNG